MPPVEKFFAWKEEVESSMTSISDRLQQRGGDKEKLRMDEPTMSAAMIMANPMRRLAKSIFAARSSILFSSRLSVKLLLRR